MTEYKTKPHLEDGVNTNNLNAQLISTTKGFN